MAYGITRGSAARCPGQDGDGNAVIARRNTVDGPAIDWLLSQQGPYVMITDRGFCGSDDSEAQVHRLARLERQGKVAVHDYAHSD